MYLVNEKLLEVSLNIKKCTNVSGRALHLCTKAHCDKFNDTSKSFSLTFYYIKGGLQKFQN